MLSHNHARFCTDTAFSAYSDTESTVRDMSVCGQEQCKIRCKKAVSCICTVKLTNGSP